MTTLPTTSDLMPADGGEVCIDADEFARALQLAVRGLNYPYGYRYERVDGEECLPLDDDYVPEENAHLLTVHFASPRKGTTFALGILTDGSDLQFAIVLDTLLATVLPKVTDTWGPLFTAAMSRAADMVGDVLGELDEGVEQ